MKVSAVLITLVFVCFPKQIARTPPSFSCFHPSTLEFPHPVNTHTPPANMASIANMVLPSNALLSVEAWANTEFPRFYAPLYNKKNPQDVQLRSYDGYERGGNVQQQPVSIFAVLVGEMDDDVSVISRLAHNGQVELYYERKYLTGQVIVVPVEDVKKIRFYTPFSHPIDANSPASINRVECLIRWTYLVGGLPYAIQNCQEYFKVHFRDACRDVARAEGAVADDDDAGADNNSPGKQHNPIQQSASH